MSSVIAEAEKLEIPGVVIVVPDFTTNAYLTGVRRGVPALQRAIYPGAIELHSDDEIEKYIEDEVYPQVVEQLTTQIDQGELYVVDPEPDPRKIVFTGTLEEVNRYFTDNNWSDGGAIIPPTIERVEEFLKYTPLPPDEVIAEFTEAGFKATPWNIAVNGVMAGCRPEYMPVLIAMVESMGLTGGSYGSTHSFTPFASLNGPVARQLNFESKQGLISHTTNSVVGRTLEFIVKNILQYRIRELRMGSFGYQNPVVLAEDEEYIDFLGWEPFHVQKGFGWNDSTVSTGMTCIWGQNSIPVISNADINDILTIIAYDIVYKEAFGTWFHQSARTLLLSQPVAYVLARAGWTVDSIKTWLKENAQKPTYERTYAQVHGSAGFAYPSLEEQYLINVEKEAVYGKLPLWYPRSEGWENVPTSPCIRNIEILVCSDRSRNKVQTLAARSVASPKKIQLPGNWNELMEKLGYAPLETFYLK